jgi:hypothetical protein
MRNLIVIAMKYVEMSHFVRHDSADTLRCLSSFDMTVLSRCSTSQRTVIPNGAPAK